MDFGRIICLESGRKYRSKVREEDPRGARSGDCFRFGRYMSLNSRVGSEFISWRSKVGVAASTEISLVFFLENFVNFPRETNAINQVFDFFIKQKEIVIKM